MMPMDPALERMKYSGIRRFTALAAQTPGCISLALGEPDGDTPQVIRDAAIAALQAGQTHYAPNQGLPALREAIADFESRRGLPRTPEQILVTVGATGALYTALTGILAPGDEAVIPVPAFPLYESIVTAAGAKPVLLDTGAADFQLTPEALEAAITPRTRAIVLNSPNNPTGAVYTATSLEAVKEAVLGRPIWLVCDNVYQGLCEKPCPDLSLDPALAEQTLLCQSFSKPYAMTGWRVGYLIGPEAAMSRLVLLSAAQIAAVPTFLQAACVTALGVDTRPMAAEYARRRAYVCRRLAEMGLGFPEPEGAFYCFPDISRYGLPSEELCVRMIREAGVAAVPGSCFGGEGHIRISCCCAPAELEEGLDRMENFLINFRSN